MMDRRAILATGLAAAAIPLSSSFAQTLVQIEDVCQSASVSQEQVSQLCNAVNDQLLETSDLSFGNRHNYQTRIYRSSAAHPLRDPVAHVAKKIQHWWLTDFDALNCDLLGFRVKGGSILKLALARDANYFINDVVRRWGLWLNGRDFTGQTALDFIESEMERSRGTPNENIMRRYQTLFQRFGGKRAADLTPADQPIDPFEVELTPLLRTWDRACYFNEGLAAVKRGGLWGYVDAGEQVVVPTRYDGAFAFSQGRAAVNRGGRWGYIDLTGREVIPLRYADARVFGSDGFAEVTMDGRTWTRISAAGSPA
jgi:hypothetical protein